MADSLTEKVTDAVRSASPYWGDHLTLSYAEAQAAIQAVLEAMMECEDIGGERHVRWFAALHNITLKSDGKE